MKNTEVPVYHSEVEAYDVVDENNNFIAVLFTDFHPRDGKQSGAWMTSYKSQFVKNGKDSRPHISIVMNFTRPTETKPALLTFDEVNTFLHEFGHALHGMLAKTTYESLSGTSVYRDFVELPSQIMENWLVEKEYLDKFAFHYQTGEKRKTLTSVNLSKRPCKRFNFFQWLPKQACLQLLVISFREATQQDTIVTNGPKC